MGWQDIGPHITQYLAERPSELKVCGGPCPGPREWRNFYVHDIIGEARCRCCCDGNGLCWNSRDIGRFRTLYCYCSVNCCDKPVAKWREDAFTVLTVLTLRQSVPPLGEEELARRWVQAQAASSFESLPTARRYIICRCHRTPMYREQCERIFRWRAAIAGRLRAARDDPLGQQESDLLALRPPSASASSE